MSADEGRRASSVHGRPAMYSGAVGSVAAVDADLFAAGARRVDWSFGLGGFHDTDQIIPIAALLQRPGQAEHLFAVDEPLPKRDLFKAGHFHSLSCLEGLNKARRANQRFERAGVEPGEAPSHSFDMKPAVGKVAQLKIGNLQFASRRRFDRGGVTHDVVVKEVQARDRPVRTGRLGFSSMLTGRSFLSKATTP